VQGDLAFDAQLVAVCREHGVVEILTEDRDFARFETPRPIRLQG
jgi:predicted nucleic acid-binding protein